MEIGLATGEEPERRHVTWAATRKVRAAKATLGKLGDAWLAHCASGNIVLEESRNRADRTLSFIVRVADTGSVEQMEQLLRSCVSDARSALSNLVHDMAQANGATDSALKTSDFPILSQGAWPGSSDRRLKALRREVIDRVRQVQPISQPMPPRQHHPLELLRELNNQDKHRQGLWIAPRLGPDGTHQLAEMQVVMSPKQAEVLRDDPLNPDEFIDINPHPLADGATVLRARFPTWVDVATDVRVSTLSVPLTLALVAPDPASDGYPLLLELERSLQFTRSVIRWVAGVDPSAPRPFVRPFLRL